jgi:transposase
VVGSDETGVRIDGRTCWNWVFQNDEVVIHVIRRSRGAGVIAEVMDGHRPSTRRDGPIWRHTPPLRA